MTASANEIQVAARVVARRFLNDMIDDFAGDRWGWGEYMPEASERAFDAVAAALRLSIPARPDYEEYAAAMAALIADAEGAS